jgi:hypothetical protein
MGAGVTAACRLGGGVAAHGDAYARLSHTHAVAAAKNTTSASRLPGTEQGRAGVRCARGACAARGPAGPCGGREGSLKERA